MRHHFTGTTHTLEGRLIFDPEQHRLLEPAEVIIQVTSFRTGNYQRDRDMRTMFEAKQYPEIRFVLTRLTHLPDEAATPGLERYRLAGRIKVRSVEQPVTFDVVARVLATELEVSGKLLLTTSMFELKPPTVFGLIRVGPEVLVEIRTTWKASDEQAFELPATRTTP